MQTKLYNQTGEIIGDLQLPEKVFDLKIKGDTIQQAALAQLANSRQVIAHAKDRSEVSGGGKKPWRQKGTGRARHGSIRSPLWKGGGVTFGPTKNRNFSQKINKKTKRKAIFMALAGKARDHEILVVDDFSLEEAKTKSLAAILKNLSRKLSPADDKNPSLLLIASGEMAKIQQAIRNLKHAKALNAKSLNVLDLLTHKYILLTKEALEEIEQTYGF